ncbi:hypothetical protein D3C85_1926240 [compost metagenome]
MESRTSFSSSASTMVSGNAIPRFRNARIRVLPSSRPKSGLLKKSWKCWKPTHGLALTPRNGT